MTPPKDIHEQPVVVDLPPPGRRGRPPHTQTLDERSPTEPEFAGTQFIARFSLASLKFDRDKSISVTLHVYPEYLNDALSLRYVNGRPLSVDIQIWDKYVTWDENEDGDDDEDGDL